MKQRMPEQPESSLLTSTCSPSFNSYSNANLADRVVQEQQLYEDDNDSGFESEDEYSQHVDQQERRTNSKNDDDDDNEEEEFEFAFVTATMVTEQTSPISADEIFQNGQIRPVYPLFNTDLLRDDGEHDHQKKEENDGDSDKTTIRVPLRNLFIAERETSMTRAGINTTSSSSSSSSSCSDNDELEGVPEGTYCVWRPTEQEGRCKKSSSTGSTSSNNSSSSSKRWRFKDLIMPRSHSDGGKDSFVVFNPTIKKGGYNDEKVVVKETTTPSVGAAGKVKSAAGGGGVEKRRSYLPYRQDILVGMFR